MNQNLIDETSKLVADKKSLSAEELASLLKTSIVLAKERLLQAEQKGKLCRDESVEGLTFYPNYFFTEPSDKNFFRT